LTLQLLKNLDKPSATELLTFNRGIEREALRITEGGSLAQTPHPSAFGSKLTHPKVTTDFSEAQLELITPAHRSSRAAIEDLDQIHRYVYTQLEDELLWSASMPCELQDDNMIPLAHYGKSNLGKLKTTYRSGLGYRYGRAMQTICAVHYNFSFNDSFWQWLKSAENSAESDLEFSTRRYFELMRNFRYWSWLLTYLFGASPAACKSFVRQSQHELIRFDEDTVYLPHSTSLRSSRLGYQSDAQSKHMHVCYNSLAGYINSLAAAICDHYSPYEEIGIKVNDKYRQINTSILQSEAEFYSSIRAKRVLNRGENFLVRLQQDGVEYIEVRLLDVNPYIPLGISESEIDFLDIFLLYCLLNESPVHDDSICAEIRDNNIATVHQGRSADLKLQDHGYSRPLLEWGATILSAMSEYAETLDLTFDTNRYTEALTAQRNRIRDPELTPSGRIIRDMQDREISFFHFAMDKTLKHNEHFKSRPLNDTETAMFVDLAKYSMADQDAIEAGDANDFDSYLADILTVYKGF